MNDETRKLLEGKRETRKQLAALPFPEKLKLLEQLRERSLAIAASPLKRQMTGKVKPPSERK